MGTYSDTDDLADYHHEIRRYCTLKLQPCLTEAEADWIDALLEKAESDAHLCFLIDEADHIAAHQLGLVDAQFVQEQQQKLRTTLDRDWTDRLLNEIKDRSRKVQEYLKHKGVYDGPIDGVLGPISCNAARVLEQRGAIDAEQRELLDPLLTFIC